MGLIGDLRRKAREAYQFASEPGPRKYRKAIAFTGVDRQVSDAKWAFTHPIDRLRGRGRARGTLMTSGPFKGQYMLLNEIQPGGEMPFHNEEGFFKWRADQLGGSGKTHLGPLGQKHATALDAQDAWAAYLADRESVAPGLPYEVSHPWDVRRAQVEAERIPANYKGGKVRREHSPEQRLLNQVFEGPKAQELRASYRIDDAEQNAFNWMHENPGEEYSLPPHLDHAWDDALAHYHEVSQRNINRPSFAYLRSKDPTRRVTSKTPIGQAINRRLSKDPRWQGQHRQVVQENAIRKMPVAFGKKYELASKDTAMPKRIARSEILKRRWISGQRGG